MFSVLQGWGLRIDDEMKACIGHERVIERAGGLLWIYHKRWKLRGDVRILWNWILKTVFFQTHARLRGVNLSFLWMTIYDKRVNIC